MLRSCELNRRLFLTGASGDLGRAVSQAAATRGHDVTSVYLSHPERITAGTALRLDLTDRTAVRQTLHHLQPDVILHTAVVQNIPDPRQPILEAARNLYELRGPNCYLLAMSSDMVFDGTAAPYREDAPVSPLSYYATAKAQAEPLADGVVRTSLIYDFVPGNKQVDWLRSSIEMEQRCRLFYDEYRSPIWAINLAEAVLELADQRVTGIWHVAGPQRMSRFELGQEMLSALGYVPDDHVERVSQAGTGRPPDLTLDVSMAQRWLKTPLLTFEAALKYFRQQQVE